MIGGGLPSGQHQADAEILQVIHQQKNILRISDQQCQASMAVLYHGAVQKLAMTRQGHGVEQPFG